MNTENIRTLISILEESGLESLSYKEDGVEISLSKGAALRGVVPMEAVGSVPMAAAAPVSNESLVQSPLVGIYYSKPAPDKDAFVKVGTQVQAGDVLCIIEAMKVMNEIRAEKAGVISKILVEDGAMVEFDQPLFAMSYS